MMYGSCGGREHRVAGDINWGPLAAPLGGRAYKLLQYFAANSGRLLTKQELAEQVWGAKALSDSAISNTVAKLRRVLGQSSGTGTPIETVYGFGYCFHETWMAPKLPVPVDRASSDVCWQVPTIAREPDLSDPQSGRGSEAKRRYAQAELLVRAALEVLEPLRRENQSPLVMLLDLASSSRCDPSRFAVGPCQAGMLAASGSGLEHRHRLSEQRVPRPVQTYHQRGAAGPSQDRR